MSKFWSPIKVLSDIAFNKDEFHDYFSSNGIEFKPIPARRHRKTPAECKQGVVRSIFLRLRHAAPQIDPSMPTFQAVRTSTEAVLF